MRNERPDTRDAAMVEGGCDPEKFPAQQRDLERKSEPSVVGRDGPIHQYETTHPLCCRNKQWAIGSGRDFAMAAMYLGKTAREAVEIASVSFATIAETADEPTHNT